MHCRARQLYLYPVKGLRGCELKRARIGPLGFQDDRIFSLHKVHRDPDTGEFRRLEVMFSGFYFRMVLFSTRLDGPEDDAGARDVVVTWVGPEDAGAQGQGQAQREIRFPLRPRLDGLQKVNVDLYGSATDAYDMGDEASAFFSHYMGVETRLVHLGHYSRPVLGSGAPHSDQAVARSLPPLVRAVRRLVVPSLLKHKPERISFADMGQYLVVTQESNAETSRRLRESDPSAGGVQMDIKRFRPNIVVSGSPAPFDEEYWAELCFPGGLRMALTANCLRCQAITVDYDTGKRAADVSGQVWKKLAKDRRVDKGCSFMPIFGRYGFLPASAVGREIRVGEEAVLTRRNRERTVSGEYISRAPVSKQNRL
jgi:uncharacterized protein YcbX